MAKKDKTKIQSLIFNKRYYPTKTRVKAWLKRNPEFTLLKYKRNPIEVKEKTIRVRQREPKYFKTLTFRTINLNKKGTIKAVIGKLK